MSPREYAEHRGVTKRAVNLAIKQGRCPAVDGRIDPVAADAAWDRHTDPSRGRSSNRAAGMKPAPEAAGRTTIAPIDLRTPSDQPAPFLESRARREAALAQLEELNLAERRGELVSVEDVVAEWENRLVYARTQAYAAVDSFVPAIMTASSMDTARSAGLALLEEFLGAVSRPFEEDDAKDKKKSGRGRRGR